MWLDRSRWISSEHRWALKMGPEDRIHQDGGSVVIKVPDLFQRWGEGKRVVGPKGGSAITELLKDGTLIEALARAHRWIAKLEEGEASTLADLARVEGVTESYVWRAIRLAFLAPDLQMRIVGGRQPTSLTREPIVRRGLPLYSRDQRALFSKDPR